jgi:hypothetical protein
LKEMPDMLSGWVWARVGRESEVKEEERGKAKSPYLCLLFDVEANPALTMNCERRGRRSGIEAKRAEQRREAKKTWEETTK